jgi:hypothetical protein
MINITFVFTILAVRVVLNVLELLQFRGDAVSNVVDYGPFQLPLILVSVKECSEWSFLGNSGVRKVKLLLASASELLKIQLKCPKSTSFRCR